MKTNKLIYSIFLALFLSACGGGGSSPMLTPNIPLQENNNIETELQINRYVPSLNGDWRQ